MSLSLINLIKDENFQARLAKKVNEVKEDKTKILSAAQTYSQKYDKEIEEGEQLRRNLLSEGTRQGKTEEECFFGKGFFPTRQTPILNWLYFLLRESDDDTFYGKKLYEQRDKLNNYLQSTYKSEDEIYEETKSCHNREDINRLLRANTTVDDIGETNEPDLAEIIYGNLTLEQFSTVKKLKKLAVHNSNVEEASSAFIKCKELCKRYNLEFDKIPSY